MAMNGHAEAEGAAKQKHVEFKKKLSRAPSVESRDDESIFRQPGRSTTRTRRIRSFWSGSGESRPSPAAGARDGQSGVHAGGSAVEQDMAAREPQEHGDAVVGYHPHPEPAHLHRARHARTRSASWISKRRERHDTVLDQPDDQHHLHLRHGVHVRSPRTRGRTWIWITSKKKLAITFPRSMFLIDLLSVVPFDILAQEEGSNFGDLKMLRMLKLFRLLKMLAHSRG